MGLLYPKRGEATAQGAAALMVARAADEPLVQMATRVPASLVRRVKIFCVVHEVSVMDFVAEALREKLRRVRNRPV